MDYKEKKQLERDKLINEKKYKDIVEKAKRSSGDLKSELGINKTYEGPTPNAEYFNDILPKTHGPKEIPDNTLTEIGDVKPKSKFFNDHLDELASADIPKARQGYLNDLKKALEIGDEEMLSDLVRNRDPLAIRHEMSTALGQHVRQNYDNPLNAFKDKAILEQVPIEKTALPKGIAGQYDLGKNKIYMPKAVSDLDEKGTGTLVHELGHAKDWLINKLRGTNLNEADSVLKGSGLEAAEKAFGKHHADGFFEKEALQKLLKNGKLAAGYLGPLLKGLGVAGTAMGAMGVGQKAMAGDLTGAGAEAAEMILPEEIKMEGLGRGSADTAGLKPYVQPEEERIKAEEFRAKLLKDKLGIK
jgi:hypothetical protein